MSSKQRIVLLSVAVFLLLTAVFAVACTEEQNDENVATIYFVTDTDEQIAPVKRTIGGRMGELPTPQRENYKFEGWYTDKNGKNAVNETTMVREKAITLYAFWTFNLERKVRNDKIWVSNFASYAIDEDGKLYEWGRSQALTAEEREEMRYQYRPKHVIPDVRFETTRGTVAIDVDGNIWCMYGNPMQPNSPYQPTQITSGTRFVQAEYSEDLGISYQILAIDIDGKLWAASGSFRNPKETSLKMIQTTVGFVSISVYDKRWYAVDENGKLWAWGYNGNGLLGDGTKTNRNRPVNIAVDVKFVSVCAGQACTYAIDQEGFLWSWGSNNGGQLGDGTRNECLVPKQIPIDVRFVSVSKESFAVDVDGGLWAWGANANGNLADGTTELQLSPVHVLPDKKFTVAASDDSSTLAIDTDGNIWSWGNNCYGQRGDGTGEEYLTPFKTTSNGGIISIAVAGGRAFKLDSNGKLYAVGANGGCFGNGDNKMQTTFVSTCEDRRFKQICAGSSYTLAIDIDGNLWAWGSNGNGQLGTGDKERKNTPVQITNGTKFVQAETGFLSSFAIDKDGNLWAWGMWLDTQFFDDNAEEKLIPTKITTEQKFVKVVAREAGIYLIDTDGYLWTRGSGYLSMESSYTKTFQKVSD